MSPGSVVWGLPVGPTILIGLHRDLHSDGADDASSVLQGLILLGESDECFRVSNPDVVLPCVDCQTQNFALPVH